MSETESVKDFLKSLKILLGSERYSILRFLVTLGSLKHAKIMKLLNIESSSLVTYHLKQLKKARLIYFNDKNNYYLLTDKGKIVLEILTEFQEKYISENENEICRLNPTCKHQYISICKYCADIKKEEPLEEKKEELMML